MKKPAIKTLADLQRANREFAESHRKPEPAVETPAKQPKRRKHLVVPEEVAEAPAEEPIEAPAEELKPEEPEGEGE